MRCTTFLGFAVALLVAMPSALPDDEDERPWSEQPFLGLSVRDTKDGLVVGWVSPGPLGGRGFESDSGIQRGDNVVSVEGKTTDAAGFKAIVKPKSPGDEITLVYRRSPEASADSSVPQGGAGGEETTLMVNLGSRDEWAGQMGRGLGDRTIPDAPEGAYESLILEAAAEVGAREGKEGIGGGLDALLAYLAKVQEDALSPDALPAVVQCFRRPLALDAVEAGIAEAARKAAAGEGGDVEALILAVLDLPESSHGDLTAEEVEEAVGAIGHGFQDYQGTLATRAPVHRLLQTLRTGIYIYDDHADDHVKLINATAGKRLGGVQRLCLDLLRFAPGNWETHAETLAQGEPIEEAPRAVFAAVEGDILWHGEDPLGNLAVVGGPGPNVYDMTKVASVYDVGGDDRYEYGETSKPVGMRIVIDLAGDDVHESSAPFEGPATAVGGFSYLDDRAGNDVYRSRYCFSVGAGLLGMGILLDHAGDDLYEVTGEDSGWGIGVGFWGAGLVIDKDGHDVYRGEKYVQGVGGPRGIGMILDSKGRDLYEANGPSFGSAYDTPAVYVGMSQGFGFGIRGYAAGGVGAIYDLSGNDRYEAGEFSQAGGYYYGLGILHDLKGHDLYYGNRYGQAFSAHQAIGILVDDEGDDTYWSMTAASQAGTWDQSMGLLLDCKGNDAYRCDGLGQGGASMQALALLIDLAGNDRYSAGKGSTQGEGGGNRYHYDADKVFSFSGLFDLGGGQDTYSRDDRANDTTRGTGTWKEKKPANSSLYGVFVDR